MAPLNEGIASCLSTFNRNAVHSRGSRPGAARKQRRVELETEYRYHWKAVERKSFARRVVRDIRNKRVTKRRGLSADERDCTAENVAAQNRIGHVIRVRGHAE